MRSFIPYLLACAATALAVPGASHQQNEAPSIAIVGPNITTKWVEDNPNNQVVEVWIQNTDKNKFLTASHHLTVTVSSPSMRTVHRGTLRRLAPGQSALVTVAVKNSDGVKPGTPCSGTVVATIGKTKITQPLSGVCGIADYEATEASLQTHKTPQWFDNVKYGIFIHWGIYSVPAFGNVGDKENYAEWYWMWQHNKNDKTQTYQYHLDHYGKDFNYDQFLDGFTGKGFDAKEWVDLFADAGAQYFVPTTKHHEGFALFNFSESISRRSSVHLGPKRDFIGELFAAGKQYQPNLRRGTYFSLPEWYNPAYSNGGSFPGGPPKNPYTGATLEYTGYIPVNDFVNQVQVPQMDVLAYTYETDLMWCDIGGPNNSTYMLSKWLNWAKEHGRQVSFNSRCGLKGDYDTPEYSPNPDEPYARKWESSRGMDPHSYGYNKVTPDDAYLTGEDIVKSLIDITAKNGNFLLDIGPKGDGSIPEIMKTNLRDAGGWIRERGESIFGTRFWGVTPGEDPFRYTTTEEAFYVHHIGAPGSTLEIKDPVPFLEGDEITVLGGKANGKKVGHEVKDGVLTLLLGDEVVKGDRYVWTFKIKYGHQ